MRRLTLLGILLAAVGLSGCDKLADATKEKQKADAIESQATDEEAKPKKKKKKKKDEKATQAEQATSAATAPPKTAAAAPPAPPLDPFVEKHLALIDVAAKCGGADAIEPWCSSAKGFASGTAAPIPAGAKLGVTTFIETANASPETMAKHQHLSAFAVHQDGASTSGWISEIKANNDGERADLAVVTSALIDRLASKATPLGVKADLASYLDGLPQSGKYAAVRHPSGYVLQGGSSADVRKVGATWVSVEVPRNNPAGVWFSVFSEAAYR